MRFSKKARLNIAKWTLAVFGASAGLALTNNQAEAHHFGHRHFGCFSYGYAVPSYTSYGFAGLYSSYYGVSSPYYYASYPVYPVYYRSCLRPYRFCAPYVVYPVSNFYYSSSPSVWDYPNYWGSVEVDSMAPLAARSNDESMDRYASAPGSVYRSSYHSIGATVSNAGARQQLASKTTVRSQDAPLMMMRDRNGESIELASSEIVLGAEPIASGSRFVAQKPALLQPYSPIWTEAANGLVDDMVANGQLANAAASCKGMEKIEQPKGSGVYLRQAVLSYFEAEQSGAASTEQVLDLLEQACQAGSLLQPSELSKKSLSDYLKACDVDVEKSMEKLSQVILENPGKSGRELMLLTALLKLDGQADRARMFADEAEQLAVKSGTFRWANVLSAVKE
jgi:hypothetical protein